MSPARSKTNFIKWQMPPVAGSSDICPSPASVVMGLQNTTPITILLAPAGFGKTHAMVSEFERLRKTELIVSWVSGEALAVSELTNRAAVISISTAAKNADVIFIDDADHIAPEIISNVLKVVDYSFPPKRLVISARDVKGLGISRRIARGVTQSITADMLLWTRQLIAVIWQKHLSVGQIRTVYKMTEG